jgi:hypothetical protein
MDKDKLVKHSFWILAGCYVVLVLACLTVLATSVSDTVRKEDEELKNAEKLVTSISNPQNDQIVAAYKIQDNFVDRKKDEVWDKAWETQKNMMTWPRELQALDRYKYFGEPIATEDLYFFDEHYDKQFKDVWDVVQPVTSKGEGVVQCKGGSWQAILALDKNFAIKPVSKDDVWLTQEELWVKREMLRIIRDANDLVARFKEVTPESSTDKDKKEVKAGPVAAKDAQPAKAETAALEKDPKGVKPIPAATKTDPNHKIFRNPNWELDLTLTDSGGGKFTLHGKLTNIAKRKQSLDTKFKVFLQDPGTATEPSSELLSVKPKAVGEQKAIEGLFGVEQVLNWKTAAVKRLEDLQLMYMSSRTIRELKPPRFINTAPEGGDSATPGDTTASAGATPSATGAERGSSATPYGPGAGAVQAATQTQNGLEINRYTDYSDQVRHMPVAMVVIVDEEHLPELLAAFVNSKLRIQITQYHWQHCRERMNPTLNEGSPQYANVAPPGQRASMGGSVPGTTVTGGVRKVYGPDAGGRPRGGERDAGRGVPGPQPRGPGGYGPNPNLGRSPAGPGPGMPSSRSVPFSGPGITSEDEEQEDLNLLEVAVYGLASLYERYPPAPKKPEPSVTPDEKQPAASTTDGK